jgi:predicted ATPase
MLTEIELVGFKSFLNRELNLNKLTVLTGLNNSGKSSILQALIMMEKAYKFERNILLEGYGSAEDIRNEFFDGDISLSLINEDKKKFQTKVLKSDLKKPYEMISDEGFVYPEIIYISAHRFGPKTSIPIFNDSFKRKRIGPFGENLFQCIKIFADEPLNTNLKHENSEGETLIYNIRGWLSVISPNVEKFDYEVNEISDSSYSTFDGHRAMNVGFGLSYSLPVITSLLVSTLIPNCLVLIENPEAHIHPRGQTEIARLIALCAKAGSQIIIETHSDHLFDGIRIAAKNYKDFANDVQIHWFELNDKGNTEVYSPVLDKNGRLNEWPKGMFDQFEINSSELL